MNEGETLVSYGAYCEIPKHYVDGAVIYKGLHEMFHCEPSDSSTHIELSIYVNYFACILPAYRVHSHTFAISYICLRMLK